MKKIVIVVLAALGLGAGALVYLDQSRQAATPAAPQPPPPAASTVAPPEPVAPAPASSAAAPAPRALFVRDPIGGANLLWRFAADAPPAQVAAQAADAGWTALAFAAGGWAGDDLLVWRNDTSGELRLWRLAADGTPAAVEIVPYSGSEWRIAALADADADGDADLVWTDLRGGLAVWTLDDGKVKAQASVGEIPAGWALAQVGDFDGDGRGELFLRDGAGGEGRLLALQGTEPAIPRSAGGAGAEWTLIDAGALDATPGDDLLWRDTAGVLIGWSGADAGRTFPIQRRAVAGWAFFGLVDVDTDGRAELLWRQEGGEQTGAWRLGDDGGVADLPLPSLPQGWVRAPSGFVQP